MEVGPSRTVTSSQPCPVARALKEAGGSFRWRQRRTTSSPSQLMLLGTYITGVSTRTLSASTACFTRRSTCEVSDGARVCLQRYQLLDFCATLCFLRSPPALGAGGGARFPRPPFPSFCLPSCVLCWRLEVLRALHMWQPRAREQKGCSRLRALRRKCLLHVNHSRGMEGFPAIPYSRTDYYGFTPLYRGMYPVRRCCWESRSLRESPLLLGMLSTAHG